jgi:hypothetical protein
MPAIYEMASKPGGFPPPDPPSPSLAEAHARRRSGGRACCALALQRSFIATEAVARILNEYS